MDPITTSTWGERLLLNLFSYCLVLVPIAFIVLATRYRLCPIFQNSAIIRWFVYGGDYAHRSHGTIISREDDERLLQGEDTQKINRRPGEYEESKSKLTFVCCFLGLQLSYLIWGVLQEKIMTTKYRTSNRLLENQIIRLNNESITFNETKHLDGSNISDSNDLITFHDSQFLVFINRIVAFISSIIALIYNRPTKSKLYSSSKHTNRQKKPQAPLYEYVYSSISNILSSWCQYEALKYVNFPTQVLSKSCKIIPVMLMSKLLLNKKYQLFDYICALFLSIGMFIFLLNQPLDSHKRQVGIHEVNRTLPPQLDNKTEIHNQVRIESPHVLIVSLGDKMRNSTLTSGILILSLYLAFDSFTSNWQQSLFSRYDVSEWQMMAATNFYSIMLTLTSLHQLGHLKPAFELLASSNALLFDCLLMSIMSSVGQLFVYYTIKRYGPVIFTIIMTLRQFFAILLSYTIYGHQISLGSCVGFLIVFLVIGYQMWRKSKASGSQRSKGDSSKEVKIHFKVLNK